MLDMLITKNAWEKFFMLRRKSWFWCAVYHLLDPEFYKYTIPQIVVTGGIFAIVIPIVLALWLFQAAGYVLPAIVGIITAALAGYAWGIEAALAVGLVCTWLTAIPYGLPEFWADVKRKHRAALGT